MREILFRGKRKDNGEWAEGVYYKQTEYYGDPCEKHYIITSTESLEYDQALEYCEIIPETIGQFTGLTDENGNKIFEGDITCYKFDKYEKDYMYTIEFIPDRGGWYPFANGDGCGCCEENTYYPTVKGVCDYFTIIGNIHDNPELLEEQNGEENR